MKRIIRLTEGDLHRIIKESVNRIISENEENENWLDRKFSSRMDEEEDDTQTVGCRDSGQQERFPQTPLSKKFSEIARRARTKPFWGNNQKENNSSVR
jgi:RNase P subunit RPR2